MRISDWSSDVCSSDLPPVRADRNRAQAEIFLPLCKGGFIENDLGVPAGDGSPEPFTVLSTGFEFAPIEEIAILLRNAFIVLLDAALHFFKQRPDQRLVPFHRCFEIRVLRLQIRSAERRVGKEGVCKGGS